MRRQSIPITVLTLLFLLSLVFTAAPTTARAGVSIGVSVYFGPPEIPVYEQPPDLWPNYVWSPGYWAWDDGYYWVPGTWVPAPEYGLYWTPGYWAWHHGYYSWSQGYWATQVGFYGGVNYGFGYYGNGYVGGGWQGNSFRYNTAITNVDRGRINNVYSSRAGVVDGSSRVSYNGGRGGLTAQATQNQLAVQRGHHVAATSVQTQHQSLAAQSRANFSTVNHGRPAVAAVARPFSNTNRPAAQHAATTQRATTQHAATTQRATTQHAATTQRATTQHAATTQRAVTQHAAVQQRAVTQHAAVQQRAVTQRAAAPQQQQRRTAAVQQQRSAPQQRAVTQRVAPQARQASAGRPAQGGGHAAPPQGGNPNRKPGS